MDQLSDYDFLLPKELIATKPLLQRGSSRLMALVHNEAKPRHDYFKNIGDYLQAGDLLVVNNTKVMKARLYAYKKTGGRVEILLVRPLEHGVWAALINAKSGLFEPGTELKLDHHIITLLGKTPEGLYICNCVTADLASLALAYGELPLPPYFGRKADSTDEILYQTIFASDQTLGAVAAPTAGLHFTDQLLAELAQKNINLVETTLHVGPGTFLPVRSNNISEHIMHEEYFSLSEDTAHALNQARREHRRIVVVGTTAMRVVEQVMQWALKQGHANFFACQDKTGIFIRPGYQFLGCDALISNFHVPKSTLLMLVCAVAGYQRLLNAYHEAIEQNYRFFSYGDACYFDIIRS